MTADLLAHLSWCPACHGDQWEPGDDDLCDRHDTEGAPMTTTDPTTVTGDQIRQALDVLGIAGPIEDIRDVTIAPGAVGVTRYRRNADGQRFRAGNDAATTITTIGIRWDEGTP
jgi:hypothetical protein